MKELLRSSVLAMSVMAILPAAVRADDNAAASAPTFTKDIQPIFQKNCQECHRPSGLNLGGIVAPMALTTYEEVRPWVKSIAKTVKNREMPPWHASTEQHGLFHNERRLTDAEIATVSAWATSGAPMGDPKDAPAPMQWPEGEWAIGKPDLVLTFDEPFEVKDEVRDLNIDIATQLTEAQVPEDRYIVAAEFKAGCNVVHHIIGYVIPGGGKTGPFNDHANQENDDLVDTKDNKKKDDNKDSSVEGRGGNFGMVGGMAPGTSPDRTPEGFGLLMPKGARFVFQMHYNKEPGPGTARKDRSSAAFKFAPKGAKITQLHYEAIGDTMRLKVPAGDPNYRITSARTFDKPVIVTSYLPHMHLRGVYAKYVAFYPNGKQETLLEVPKWSFNWQTSYKYAQPKQLPAGTKLEVTLGYDNSANNKANPDPTKDVVWGLPTFAEMNLGWLTWANAEPTEPTKPGAPIPGAAGGN